MNNSEIRKHYFLNKYVIITPGRSKRPFDTKDHAILDRSENCFFCPDNLDKKNLVDQIKKGKNWQVVSLKNIYPAVSPQNNKAYGYQEVIIETPNHFKELGQLSKKEIKTVLKMFSRRTQILSKDKKINYILCFKNQGIRAGASKVHAHSQIFATAILPPDVEEEMHASKLYQTENKTCPYCDIIKKELRSPRRIFEDNYIAVIAPYASQFHYEAWIFTKRHTDNITTLKPKEIESLAQALKKILFKLNTIDLSYNFFMHQVISETNQHFYIKIEPRGSVWAGVELGSGLIINSISPEEAAKFYKK